MPEIAIDSDGKKEFAVGQTVLLKVTPTAGVTDFVWKRDGVVQAGKTLNQLTFPMTADTGGTYSVEAVKDGQPVTASVTISLPAAAPANEAKPGDGTGAGAASPPEPPAAFYPKFAMDAARLITLFGVILVLGLGLFGYVALSGAAWTSMEGRLKIAVILGLPTAILGGVVILVGLWMAVVEWRGRLTKPVDDDEPVARGLPSGDDVSKVITAVGALRGPALALVVGAILMLGTAWIAQSAAGTAGPVASPEATQVTAPTPK
jgi:hypothetical protein